MKGWLREPLVHFLVVGSLLFVLSGAFGSGSADDDTIVVSEAAVGRLAQLFAQQWQRPPTRQELDNLVEQHVREEVLYREAVAMGLDQNDTIVRRRMVQKLEFLSHDLVDDEPSEAALRAFFEEHPARFEEPAQFAFRHVYLNPDHRGDALEPDAAELLRALRDGSSGDPEQLGDTFLLPLAFERRPQPEFAGLFGAGFAAALANLEVGAWEGPVPSGYGLHLVQVQEHVDARLPAFGGVRDKVRVEYLNQERRRADEEMYQRLREQYRIEIDWPGDGSATEGAPERSQ